MTTGGAHHLRLYREASRRAVPIEVMIELTQRCNLRCRHCYLDDFGAPDLLSTARVRELLAELAGLGTLVLGLSGGEVLLRPDLLEIAGAARGHGFQLEILTNATLVDEEFAARLAPLHPRVHVSFYSHEEATFDAIAGTPGTFRRVERGIRLLLRHGVDVLLKMPLLTPNLGHVAGVRAWAAAAGAECRTAPAIFPKRDGGLAPLALRAPAADALHAVGGPETGCDEGEDPGADGDRPLCAAGTRYAVITSGGDLLPCNVLPLVAGNVLARPFAEVWREAPLLARLRALRRGDLPVCGSCAAFAACGRCHAEALLEGGDLLGPSPAACARAEALGLGPTPAGGAAALSRT